MILTRRSVLVASAAAASLLAAPAIVRAAPARKFRIGHTAGADTALGRGAAGFAEALAKLSDGRLTAETFPNNALGTENDMAKAVAQGSLDMSNIAVASIGEISDEVALMDMPYLFKDVTHARACCDGAMGKHCAEVLKPKGVVALGFAENGLRHMTANKPIRSAADLKGLKLRTPTSKVVMESFRALGAEAETYPWAQLPEALKVGKFEAQENPVVNILSAKLYQWQSHITLTGHIYAATILGMSAEVWEELTEEDRKLVQAAAIEGVKASRAASDAIDRSGLEELKAKGMTVITDIDHASFHAAAAAAVPAKLSALVGAEKVERMRKLAA